MSQAPIESIFLDEVVFLLHFEGKGNCFVFLELYKLVSTCHINNTVIYFIMFKFKTEINSNIVSQFFFIMTKKI